jgi:hypothetical protein
MKNLDLIEVTLDEPVGGRPISGTGNRPAGHPLPRRQRAPPKVVSGRWRRQSFGEPRPKWTMLVEKLAPPTD